MQLLIKKIHTKTKRKKKTPQKAFNSFSINISTFDYTVRVSSPGCAVDELSLHHTLAAACMRETYWGQHRTAVSFKLVPTVCCHKTTSRQWGNEGQPTSSTGCEAHRKLQWLSGPYLTGLGRAVLRTVDYTFIQMVCQCSTLTDWREWSRWICNFINYANLVPEIMVH